MSVQRIIKFRVWDKKNNKYWHDIDGMVNSGIIINANGIPGIACENTKFVFLNSEFLVIQQSTGLKDKNGTEIYEGDIINGCLVISQEEKETYFDTIEYEFNGAIEFQGCGFYCQNADFPLDQYDNLEILGNIFENLELLENKIESQVVVDKNAKCIVTVVE